MELEVHVDVVLVVIRARIVRFSGVYLGRTKVISFDPENNANRSTVLLLAPPARTQ